MPSPEAVQSLLHCTAPRVWLWLSTCGLGLGVVGIQIYAAGSGAATMLIHVRETSATPQSTPTQT
eukprot:m.137868 g.137868  ORF g.137868 m.137868 type:complete len:65 (-) comp22703_c0_seq1:1001-1195(-)